MKIEKLILKNFSAVKNAMNCNTFTLHTNQCENKICLLIGPNGGGKTTILSLLSPFADLGNLDVRNNQPLILKGKEGYKEIHISKNESLYIIKHIYTPHEGKSHSVKSYIIKDGDELNVNGNVTSFKEIVKEELQIEPEYLKLIRLGSNVTSMIDLSETERKTFMSKILDDIGVYLDHYKNVNDKLRRFKDTISHTVNKLDKLGVSDKTILETMITNLKRNIESLEESFNKNSNYIAVLNSEIEKIDDKENLRDNLSIITKKLSKMESIMAKKDEMRSKEVSFYDNEIKEIEDRLSKLTNEVNVNNTLISRDLNDINNLTNSLHSLRIQEEKEKNAKKELDKMNDNLISLRKELRKIEENIKDFSPNFTLSELEEFIIHIKNIQQILNNTYEFGKKPVTKVVKLMSENQDVTHYINSHIINIDETKSDDNTLFLAKLQSQFRFNDEVVNSCTNECEAKKLYLQIKNLLISREVKDKDSTYDFYNDMNYVYQNIHDIIDKIYKYEDLIKRLPEDISKSFTISTIFNNISNLKYIYDESKINDLLSITTEYDRYLVIMKKYSEEEENISKFKGLSNSEYILDQIEETSLLLEKKQKEVDDLKEYIFKLKEEMSELSRTLDVDKEVKETLEKYDEVKELYKKLTDDHELFISNTNKIKNTQILLSDIKFKLDKSNSELQENIIKLNQYEELTKELNKYNKIYDDMTLIKDALSSKSGIPLHYILNYLGNTVEITNDLLSLVYDDLYIDEFEVTPTTFSIPFYNKGVRLPDVKYASQGEISFLSIALSFALSSQALAKYNIMLLDEIDGPLDTRNREKFIRILERQIDRIDSEQNFLITHNSMFSSYPVDIIDLSFENKKDDYPLANFIEINRE